MKTKAFILILTLSLLSGRAFSQCVTAGAALADRCQGETTEALGGSFGDDATSAIWDDNGAGGVFTNNDGSTPETTTYTAAATSATPVTLTLTAAGGTCDGTTVSKQLVVNPAPVLNAITGTDELCAGTAGEPYSVSLDNTGTATYLWDYSGTGATLSSSSGNAITINFAGNATSGDLTVVETIILTGCSTTNTLAITVNPAPVSNAVTGTDELCAGTTGESYAVSVNNSSTATYLWDYSGTGATLSSTSGNAITINFAGNATSGDLTVVETIILSGCSTTNTLAITVNSLPASGLNVGGAGAVCSGTGTFITVDFSENGVDYQLRNDADNSAVGSVVHGNTGTISLPTGDLTVSTTFNVMAVNTTTTCSAELTETATVTVDPITVGGTVSTTLSEICYDISPSDITLSGNIGNVVRWESADNAGFSGATSYSVTSTTLTGAVVGNLTKSTWFRAVVKSGYCAQEYSSSIRVTVHDELTASITGGITPICFNTSPGEITAYGSGGDGSFTYEWYSTSGGGILGTDQSFNPGSLTSSRGFYCILTSSCGSVPTSTTSIVVRSQITLTTVTQFEQVCSGYTATIILEGLLSNSTSIVDYSINGVVQTPVTGVAADDSGVASFTTDPLSAENNGKILRITGITTGLAPACSAIFTRDITLIINSATTPTILGVSPVCVDTHGLVYTTEDGMTDYSWSFSGGGTYTGGTDTDNTITVDWTSVGTHDISVNYSNSNGCTAALSTVKYITVSALPTPTITGPSSVCVNSTGNAYTTESDMSSYSWLVSPGGQVMAGGDGNVIVVKWNTAGSQTVSVNYENSSGCDAALSTVYNVEVNPLPVPVISGPATPRVTSVGNVYSTEDLMTNYVWTVSGGGTITAGGTAASNTVAVTWNSTGNQTVSVRYTNSSTCIAADPTVYDVTVDPLPVATSVAISGIPGIDSLLEGSYSYTDVSPEGTSLYSWLRNGTTPIPGATAINYTPTADDLNQTITFEVTPVSTTGTPNSGIPVRSAQTAPVEDLSEIPVVDEVCIEGVRISGNTLKGKYRYLHSKAEGASTYQWLRNGIPISGETGTLYTLLQTEDIDSDAEITFMITPVSSNIIPLTGTPELSDPMVRITLPQDEYSIAVSEVVLTANQPLGVFSGPGVTNGIFSPSSAGLGDYTIQYLLSIVNPRVTCSQKAFEEVRVVTNTTDFGSFKSVYCQDEGTDEVTVEGIPAGSTSVGFHSTDPDAIVSQTDWTVIIDPSKLNQGNNVDSLYFRYKDVVGYVYEIGKPFVIDAVGTEIQILNLDDEYCADAPKAALTITGATPAGGMGAWTGTVITDIDNISASVDVSKVSPGHKYPITYQYTSPLGCKSEIIKDTVLVNPLPDPSFALNLFYNFDGPDIDLVPVQPGGNFSGEGVLSGTKLSPDDAGLGEHTISYYIKDDNGCDDDSEITTTIKKAVGTFTGIPQVICYDDTTFNIKVTELPDGITVRSFTNTKNSIIHIPDSTNAEYNVPAAGEGLDTLIFSYELDAVDYWISTIVNIDSLGLVEFDNLFPGDKKCDNIGLVKLNALPTGGVFSGPVDGNYLDPKQSPGPYDVTYVYTVVYTNTEIKCSISKTVPIEIIKAPKVSFVPEDVCIAAVGKDSTYFLNTTVSPDPVYSWQWKFAEIGNPTDGRKEPGFLYTSGGIHTVLLEAKTVSGCRADTSISVNLGIKPFADFYWEHDCFAPGQSIKLYDATISDVPVISNSWNFDDGRFLSSALDPEFPMQDTGYVDVEYVVLTNYSNCADTVLKRIFLRPTISLSSDDYYAEDFEDGKGGWIIDDTVAVNSWRFGTPDRRVINNAASGARAWFTQYDTLKQSVESSSVISPCFDFTDIQRPMISLKTWKRFDRNRNGAALQYKSADAMEWEYVGTLDDGINWYNSSLINGRPGGDKIGWTTTGDPDTSWIESRHKLDELQGKKDVKFRISYGSDGTSTDNEGIAFDDIAIGERSRLVLLEHFANTSTVQSSTATGMVNDIALKNPEDVINIQYHTNFPGTDPYYYDNPGDASARILFYGLSKAPFTFLDGGNDIENYANSFDYRLAVIDSNDVSRRSLIDPYFSISIVPTLSDNILKVNTTIKAVKNIVSENVTLYLAVTEKQNNDVTGANGETVFYNVFRKFIPDAGGISLKTNWAKGDVEEISDKSWKISKIKDNSDIEVVAFIQNANTKELYQATSDIISDITVGIDVHSIGDKGSFTVYPNPATERITVSFNDQLGSDTDIRIYDLRGIVIRSYRVESGSSEYTIENPGFRGGIYLIRVSSGGTDLGFKKLIISAD